MEDYIGTKLLFETNNGITSGILRRIEEELGKFIIEDDGKLKEIYFDDVTSLEFVDETNNENKEVTNEATVLDKHSEENKQIYSLDKKNLKSENTVSKSFFEEKKEKSSHSNENGNSNATTLTLKNQSEKTLLMKRKQYTDSQRKDEIYYGIMNKAFTYYGPLEDEFAAISAKHMYRIFVSHFKVNQKVEIVVRGEGVFTKIGYILARLLHKYKVDVTVVGTSHPVSTAPYRESYINSGGSIASVLSGTADVCIFSCNRSFISLYSFSPNDGAIYLDIPEISNHNTDIKIGICFGLESKYVNQFQGIIYCINVEYPDILYNEYGLPIIYKRSITMLK